MAYEIVLITDAVAGDAVNLSMKINEKMQSNNEGGFDCVGSMTYQDLMECAHCNKIRKREYIDYKK
ncbi:hypothetical protein [Dialister invisus]|uniref:hypothetical protein n=1 Tax=Dialister invisus TaxID=218538 RepID=UPI0032C12C49